MAPRKNQSMSKKISFFQKKFFSHLQKGGYIAPQKDYQNFLIFVSHPKIHLNSLTCVFLASKVYQEIRQLSTECGGRHGYKKIYT